ncbi:response regulator transcription factor [Sphingosinicella terrae]|jgi:two-component system, LuxR family, response regulator FixJ|uniref:response regulator transcription factor n=1 Tax=Sphingosinicella terrae TaxID=2172047 RepID=UPI000E0DDFCF|nr:response regulator [Sphingosinicella terrae]
MTEENEKIPTSSHFVYVVDDDRDVRRSLSFMLGASEIRSHPFASGEDFLDAIPDLQPGCILLDLRMPQMDGFHVMTELSKREIDWPVIVMTGHGEVPVAVRAMKLGAIDFIEKPFSEDALLACFANAFTLLDQRESSGRRKRAARDRVGQLTARETDVLRGLLAGESNKQLAARLGISLRTVEMHRGNMMDRLQVASLAEALTLALEAGVDPANADEG